MNKFLKYFLILVGVVIIALVGLVSYVKFALPNIDAPNIKVEVTPERVERGKYLANHVTVCMDCHSTREWNRFAAPPKEGTLGRGGEKFDKEMGFPGTYYSVNITPSHLKNWSDGEIYRAITSGVSKDGRALFPIMPYPYYGTMDKEDIYSIIAYLRSLDPIEYEAPAPHTNFPMNIIMNMIPKEPAHEPMPSKTDVVKYGKYLVNAAGCIECHTQAEKGQIIPDKAFSGGREFKTPNGILRTPNITPNMESGIGNWTKEMFVAKFKSYASGTYVSPELPKNEINTIMPWTMYADMNEDDLGAIYEYLRTVKPMHNFVVKYSRKM